MIGLAVLIVGYCSVRAVQIGRSVYGIALKEGASVAGRMDTTFHVQEGSQVYLNKAALGPLAKVIVIHGDTTLASSHRTSVESTMVAALRHEMVMYTMAAPTDSATTARILSMQPYYGTLQGRYDGAEPIRIDLIEGTMPTVGKLADGFLKVAGRANAIPLFRSPIP